MYTYTYAAIPQSLNGSALKEFVYKVSSKPLNVCVGGGEVDADRATETNRNNVDMLPKQVVVYPLFFKTI